MQGNNGGYDNAYPDGHMRHEKNLSLSRIDDMKNIMIIDGANNCAFDIFQTTDEFFKVIFPEDWQDIEFIEDLMERCEECELESGFLKMWKSPISKKNANGIHGILFYELRDVKKKYYPNKKDSDLDLKHRNFSTSGYGARQKNTT